jgi:hypothetical protein
VLVVPAVLVIREESQLVDALEDFVIGGVRRGPPHGVDGATQPDPTKARALKPRATSVRRFSPCLRAMNPPRATHHLAFQLQTGSEPVEGARPIRLGASVLGAQCGSSPGRRARRGPARCAGARRAA